MGPHRNWGPIPDKNGLNFSWLLKLRAYSIAGQTATILGVYFLLRVKVPLSPLLAIVGVELLSNIAYAVWFRPRRSPRLATAARRGARWGELSRHARDKGGRESPPITDGHLMSIMALDVALLSGLLYFTGGPFNPFSFLYLVNIALAAVTLRARYTWMLVALSLIGFGLLLAEHRPLPLQTLSATAYLDLYQQGMWVAFGVAASFIVHFLWRVTGALAERERELSEARNRAAQKERLAALATMAAGAAHELATPLGTIALCAKELSRAADAGRSGADMKDDLLLMRDEVGRCRVILDQMAAGSGGSAGEGITEITVGEVIRDALAGTRAQPPIKLAIPDAIAATRLRVTPRAMAQALRSVLTNAQDASAADTAVVLSARADGPALAVEIKDTGQGMAPEILARVGEPFFTTKPPGRGMGLGLFLTRAVIDNLGGTLKLASEPGQGTRVSIELPMDITRPLAPTRSR
ncbi:MAG TPA: ATP-binding protein [Kofleriaceae bacterium]|nr:ATP-binding protein [Kofleriaceae bacterium]